VAAEVIDVANEMVLVEAMCAWADQEFPGERATADRAVAVAKASSPGGESVAEACQPTTEFLRSWARHRANRKGPLDTWGTARVVKCVEVGDVRRHPGCVGRWLP